MAFLLVLCILWLPHGLCFPVDDANSTVEICKAQVKVLNDFVQLISDSAPYLTGRTASRYPYYDSGGCSPCSARRPPRRPPTTLPPQKEEMPDGVQIRLKERNKMVYVKASSPESELEVSNGTVMMSKPSAHWFERKSVRTGGPGQPGSFEQKEDLQEAEGDTIYIIDNERNVEYFDKEEDLDPFAAKMKQKRKHLELKRKHKESKAWMHGAFSRWHHARSMGHDDHYHEEDEDCVLLLLCMIGLNPNDFGRVGQDMNNFLRGPQTDALRTISRYMTALRIGTRTSTFNVNNPCSALSSTCMASAAPAIPLWPFVNDNFSH